MKHLGAAVKLSVCPGLQDRHLPDKALDLLDEACARAPDSDNQQTYGKNCRACRHRSHGGGSGRGVAGTLGGCAVGCGGDGILPV